MPTFSIRMDDMLCSRMSQLSPRKIQFFTSSECSGRPLARSLTRSRGLGPCGYLMGGGRRGRLISFTGNFSSPPAQECGCKRLASEATAEAMTKSPFCSLSLTFAQSILLCIALRVSFNALIYFHYSTFFRIWSIA